MQQRIVVEYERFQVDQSTQLWRQHLELVGAQVQIHQVGKVYEQIVGYGADRVVAQIEHQNRFGLLQIARHLSKLIVAEILVNFESISSRLNHFKYCPKLPTNTARSSSSFKLSGTFSFLILLCLKFKTLRQLNRIISLLIVVMPFLVACNCSCQMISTLTCNG